MNQPQHSLIGGLFGEDPTKKFVSETGKLSGNLVHGIMMTNKEKLAAVKYTSSPRNFSMAKDFQP